MLPFRALIPKYCSNQNNETSSSTLVPFVYVWWLYFRKFPDTAHFPILFFPLIAFFLNKIQKEEHCLTCLLTSIPTPFLTKTQPSHLVSLVSPNLWLQVPFCWITQFRTFNQDSPGSTEMEHLPSVLFLGYHRINWSPAWPVVDPKSFLVAPSASPELSLP